MKDDRSLRVVVVGTAFMLGYALADALPHDKWISLIALAVLGAVYVALLRYVKVTTR